MMQKGIERYSSVPKTKRNIKNSNGLKVKPGNVLYELKGVPEREKKLEMKKSSFISKQKGERTHKSRKNDKLDIY